VKNLAKLVIFFSLCFVVIFLAATGFRFLSLQIDWASNLPQKPEILLTTFTAAAHWALLFSLYITTLLSLSYAARRHCFAPMTVLCVFILSMCFCFGFSIVLDHWESVPPAQVTGKPLGESGLILANSLNRNETAVILLKGSEEPYGPRVVVIPGQPMLFQEASAGSFELPPVPFGDDTPWFLKSAAVDIRLSGRNLQRQFNNGFMPFLIYSGALLFLLSSLGFAIKFSAWPLANLFLGILAFRGVLALETFFISPEMQEILDSFLNNMISVSLAVPLIFFGFGVLVHIYSILVYAVKRKRDDYDN